MPHLFLGLISGTSADGIDAALVEFPDSGTASGLRLVAARTHLWAPALRGRLAWQEPALERIPLMVGFNAPRPGQPDWAAIFERGLRELHASGEYMRILRRYAAPR